MGLTYIEGIARSEDGKEAQVTFLVDSGAGYTLLPLDVWQQIGLEPLREQGFTLADGTEIQRHMSDCRLVLPQGETPTPVILGQEGDDALLGVVTLEESGLMLNPFSRTLQPMRMMLA